MIEMEKLIMKKNVFEDVRGKLIINDIAIKSKLTFDNQNYTKSSIIDTYNIKKNTFRGFHYQISPYPQIKIVRAIKGSFLDIFFDYRLKKENISKALVIKKLMEGDDPIIVPPYCAHATLSLEDNNIISYLIIGEHNKDSERNIRLSDVNTFLPNKLDIDFISKKDA